MKNLFSILSFFSLIAVVPSEGQPGQFQDQFKRNRSRVYETLLNLPIQIRDWRSEDLKANFIEKWKTGVFFTSIICTESDTLVGKSPAKYYMQKIYFNPANFNNHDFDHVIEHELYHGAFDDSNNLPDWLVWLMTYSDSLKSGDIAERISMTLTARRDVVDYFALPLNSTLNLAQIQKYVNTKTENKLDAGMKILLQSTKWEHMVCLLNLINPYEYVWQ